LEHSAQKHAGQNLKPKREQKMREIIRLKRVIKNTGLDNIFYKKAVADYNASLESINLLTSDEIKRLLLIQTVEGHAMKGHGKFGHVSKRKPIYNYLNATIEAVVNALDEADILEKFGLNKKNVTEQRQKLIDDIADWAENACNYVKKKQGGNLGEKIVTRLQKPKELLYLKNSEAKPLMEVPIFNDIEIKDPLLVLKGMYLASRMDSIEWRKKTVERYKNTDYKQLIGLGDKEFKMGGGTCLAVNLENLMNTRIEEILGKEEAQLYAREYGNYLSMEFISKIGLEEHLEKLFDRWIIIEKESEESTENIVSGYVRHIKGPGVSDDLAVIMAGSIYGMEAAYGVYLVDAIDTFDKYTPRIMMGGQDENLGNRIEKLVPNIASEDELTSFIALIYNKNKERIADSSQRRFLEISPLCNTSTLESHLGFIRDRSYCPDMLFGFTQVPATAFYEEAERRIELADKISRM